MNKDTVKTDVKAFEIAVASVMIAGGWLVVGLIVKVFAKDVFLPILVGFLGYVVTMSMAVNVILKEFLRAVGKEKS